MSKSDRIRRALADLRALDAARDAIRTWEREQRTCWRHEPLPLCTLQERRAVVAASGLRRAGAMGALVADALVDGVLSRETYVLWVFGDRDPSELVGRILPHVRAAAFRDPDRAIPASVRRTIIERDGKHCQLGGHCTGSLALDHLIAWVWGGPSETGNLWPLCHRLHNMEKLASFPTRDTLTVWLTGGRPLPKSYGQCLGRRPWRAWEAAGHDVEQTWEDEVRTINRRLKRERRVARARWWAEQRPAARTAATVGA